MSDRSVLVHRDFRLLLAGQTTSQFGSQVSAVAFPLLAVAGLGATAGQVGAINAASTIGFALIGLPAGAWLDRCRRRPVLITADLTRAGLLATIPAAAFLGWLTLTQLIIVSLLVGIARVFFDIGYRSYLPAVIGNDQVLAGNSALEFVRASGQIAGPGLGGVLVAVIRTADVIGLQAITFAVSALTLTAIRRREPVPKPDPGRPLLREQVAQGLRYVWDHPALRATAIASAASNLSFAIASAVSIIFMSRTLGLSAAVIGLIVAAGSGTVMLGAAAASKLSRWIGSARIIWLSLAVTAPVTFLGPLAQPGPLAILIAIGAAAGELGQIIYAITNVSLRQRICPDRMLARVNATMTVLIMGLFPVGALAGGWLGELLGPRITLLLACRLVQLLGTGLPRHPGSPSSTCSATRPCRPTPPPASTPPHATTATNCTSASATSAGTSGPQNAHA